MRNRSQCISIVPAMMPLSWRRPETNRATVTASPTRPPPAPGGSQPRRTPYGEPLREVRLDPQVIADRGPKCELALVVPLLRTGRHERVPRAALVEVDQPERRVRAIGEDDEGA